MSRYNWESIQHKFRSGRQSIRAIAREHGCSEAAIRKKAKANGWERTHSIDGVKEPFTPKESESEILYNRQGPALPTLKRGDQNQLQICPSNQKELQNLFNAFGTSNKETAELLLTQLSCSIGRPASPEHLSALLPVLQAINPRDEMEGMLAVQMLATYNLSMATMRQCMDPNVSHEHINAKINQTTKLNRTFVALLETLNKHRGKGQQQVIVKHIHLNNSQAVIDSDIGGGGD